MLIKKYFFIIVILFISSCSTENKMPKENHLGELNYQCRVNRKCDEGLVCNDKNKCIEKKDLCKFVTCLNHGSCVVENNIAICNCENGYHREDKTKCIVDNCIPDCSAKQCGDNGCGGSCGTCSDSQSCSNNQCVDNCTPDCSAKQCGDDGCGGSCGTCGDSQSCSNNQCVDNCIPDCSAKQCGDDGCGGSCGTCNDSQSCSNNQCVDNCTPDCSAKQCGDDGCGGSCGTCGDRQSCNNNQCVNNCIPKTCNELNAQCGSIDNGCSSSIYCGNCGSNEYCSNNICYCDNNYHDENGNCVANGPCYNVTCDSWKECNENNGNCELKANKCDNTADCNNSDLVCSAHDCINPCDGQTCSNHGYCSVENGLAVCTCYDGYYLDGLNCLELPISKTFALNNLRLNMGDKVKLKESFLVMQSDGNLVLYSNNNTALWESNTNTGCSNCNYYFRFQLDGNLVVYNSNNLPLWASVTNNNGVHHLSIDNEKLGLYDNYGNLIWNSICTTSNLDSNAVCTLGPGGNRIVDSYFENINTNLNNQNIHGGGTRVSPNWILKTNDDNLLVSTSNISDGIQINADYSSVLGYLYIRQIIPNVFQFENKTITLEVEYTNNSEQNLQYDVYIQARFNPDNTTRILVTDTPAYTFELGRHKVIHTFEVPDFGNNIMEDTEGLSVAFRVIAQNKTADFKIHSYKLIIHGN